MSQFNELLSQSSRITLGEFPTRIEKLSYESKASIWVKRDDATSGPLLHGNKLRKAEYLFGDALEQNADRVVTWGSPQSNHCRVIAAAATQLGLESKLLLLGENSSENEGNDFFFKLLGVEAAACSSREEIQGLLAVEQQRAGTYVIPLGGSNLIGAIGYMNCMAEILDQSRESGVSFDTIVVPAGSGGTFAGLAIAANELGYQGNVLGVLVNEPTFVRSNVQSIFADLEKAVSRSVRLCDQFQLIDGFVGEGYGKSRSEELRTGIRIVRSTGLVLDPVYTLKAFSAIDALIVEGVIKPNANVLFIHTGGIFGLQAFRHQLEPLWIDSNRS